MTWTTTRDTLVDRASRSPQSLRVSGFLRACICRRAKTIDGTKRHGWELTVYEPLGVRTQWFQTEETAKRAGEAG